MTETYVVCGSKSWNRRVFDDTISKLPGTWQYFSSKEELTAAILKKISPRYVFFLHWSWIVPQEIISAFECVNFHMTDLPFGRGGSPLQHLILLGKKDTVLTAHRMTEEIDAGPVYLKQPMSLDGTAQEILERSSELAAQMIGKIISTHPEPTPQTGKVVTFKRRTPQESEIPPDLSPEKLYDFIRMLDGEGYPAAFTRNNGFRYEQRNARLVDGRTEADVSVVPDTL
ncbi:MAG: methionyl-tRNA formyltransferase [Candidatus Peribacteraceae bacterium]|nr:methionyl-tRNA formyltransferase [Candidatus Peribacteraceae bacterium]